MTGKEQMFSVVKELYQVQEKIAGLRDNGIINQALFGIIYDKICEARNYLSGYAETVKDFNKNRR